MIFHDLHVTILNIKLRTEKNWTAKIEMNGAGIVFIAGSPPNADT